MVMHSILKSFSSAAGLIRQVGLELSVACVDARRFVMARPRLHAGLRAASLSTLYAAAMSAPLLVVGGADYAIRNDVLAPSIASAPMRSPDRPVLMVPNEMTRFAMFVTEPKPGVSIHYTWHTKVVATSMQRKSGSVARRAVPASAGSKPKSRVVRPTIA